MHTRLDPDMDVRTSPHGARPADAVVDEIHRACRAASMMAQVAQKALHEDPRFSAVWMRAGRRPGAIDIGGRVADHSLLALLQRFADDWGDIRVAVKVDARSTMAANESESMPARALQRAG